MAQSAAQGALLIVGRKGAGKTAIFRHLSATLDGHVVELDLLDYVFQVHQGLQQSGIAQQFAYTASWRLLIAASIFGKIRDDLSSGQRKKGDGILRELGLGSNAGPIRN